MPKIIKSGVIQEDTRPDILSLDEWVKLEDRAQPVSLQPGEAPDPLFDHLADIPLIAIHFPVFTDGRGFSYARELRQRGYRGELRATGEFMPDQVHYLRRCGFDAFQPADASRLEEYLRQLRVFSEHYQASIDEPLPLFRRRDSESQPA